MASTVTSSFNPSYSAASAQRGNTAAPAAVQRSRFDATKGLSAMLLAAMVSALVVVADQVIETWADGHLLAAWIALWAVGFAALAVFHGAARKVAALAVVSLDAWSQRVAQRRADERLWAIAQTDPRVMADLQMAITRSRGESEASAAPSTLSRLASKLAKRADEQDLSVSSQRRYLPYV